MTVRSSRYPLDVSTRFPQSVIDQMPLVRARDRISGLTVHPDTDDLTNETLYRLVKTVWANSHRALAYCDVMDLAQEAAGARLQVLEHGLQAVRTDIAGLQSSISSVVAFLGVVIPAWLNKEEVERGDDLGIVPTERSRPGTRGDVRVRSAPARARP